MVSDTNSKTTIVDEELNIQKISRNSAVVITIFAVFCMFSFIIPSITSNVLMIGFITIVGWGGLMTSFFLSVIFDDD